MKLNNILHEDGQLHKEPLNLWEMANLGPKTTGLDGYVIFVSTGEGMRHGPRIKVCRGNKWSNDNATITISGIPRIIGDIGITPDEFHEISSWIALNNEALMQYWDGTIQFTEDFLSKLKPVNVKKAS